MCTASWTVCRESWRACVICPIEVEQSSLSTESDLILKSAGGRETSSLCLPAPGEKPEPLWLRTTRLSLTASSICGLPVQIVVRLRSSHPVLPVIPRLFLGLGVFSWFHPICSSESVFVAASQYDRTAAAATASHVDPLSAVAD